MAVLLLPCFCPVFADGSTEAVDITSADLITDQSGFSQTHMLFDGYYTNYHEYAPGSWFTLTSPEGIGSVYFLFDLEPGSYTVTDNDTGVTGEWGQYGFLHEFVDLVDRFGHAPTSVTVCFPNGAILVEMNMYSAGEVPSSVQKWQPQAEGNSDMLLLIAHSDDEQLFLGGIIPLYAVGKHKTVQVVYLSDHRNMTRQRCHEALNGLWAVGCHVYPVFGPFADLECHSLSEAYNRLSAYRVTQEDLVGFAVEQLRRFRPRVVVTHDAAGEYGHGQHMLCADIIMKASEISMDRSSYPESAQRYGTWEAAKVYLHLWKENPITLNLDEPLEEMDGLTPYLLTRDYGFPAHRTQYSSYSWYMSGHDTAASIVQHSPCSYGLYRTIVGPDRNKDDFFENLFD